MRKKIISAVLVLCALTVNAMSAGALDLSGINTRRTGSCGENLTYEFSDDRLIISGTGAMYSEREELDGQWNSNRYTDEAAVIEFGEGVSWINPDMFGYFGYAQEVTVAEENPVYEAYGGVLYNEEMTSVIKSPRMWDRVYDYPLPDSVKRIEDKAFYDCFKLYGLEIPDSVEYIGEKSFMNAGIGSAEIPSGVTEIGYKAFGSCYNMKKITVAEDNANYKSVDGVLFNADMSELIQYPRAKGATEYEIPDGVKNICDGAFEECDDIIAVTLPDGLETIGDEAFSACSSLSDIRLPDSLKVIGNEAFTGCAFSELVIPEGVVGIGEMAFYCADLVSVKIPSTLEGIPTSAFHYCDKLENVEIAEGITYIGDVAFGLCKSLKSIKIPDSVTSMGRLAIWCCDDMSEIEIPKGLVNLNSEAIYDCDNLENIFAAEDNPAYSSADGVLFNKNKTELVQYPMGRNSNEYTIPSGVTAIGDNAFTWGMKLERVALPEGILSIGGHAFENCQKMSEINLPDSITQIGEGAFQYCDSLTEVVLPEKLEKIERNLFADADKLVQVTIPDGVTSIGNRAFDYCASLTKVNIPKGVTEIGFSAFSNCALKAIEIPTGVTAIESYTFAGCDELESVIIPVSVTEIGECAFVAVYPGAYLDEPPMDIYYAGSEEDWNNIIIGRNQLPLAQEIHYNYPYEISATVNRDGDKCIVSVNADDVCDTDAVIVSGYKDGRFAESVIYSGEDIALSGDVDTVKVMLWDGIDESQPLCECKVIDE